MLSREIIPLLQSLQTPFYLYDITLLRRTLAEVGSIADRHRYKIHYAIKANFDKQILEEVRSAGFGVDCVSGGEVARAVECGFEPKGIVFAGVGKSDREIEYAIAHDIFAFNVESREEMMNINRIAERLGKVVDIALRINPDVNPDTHKHISTGQADSKFGISYKEIEQVAEELSELKNIRITGLHFHIGSQIRDVKIFGYLALRVNTLYEFFTEKGFVLTHINVGGGLGINYDNPDAEPMPDFEAYFAAFDALQLPDNIEVHFELGRSIVGQCGELICRVLYNKINAAGKNVAIIDGSMSELIRPAMYSAKHAIENLTGGERDFKTYTIGGTVCESSDIFAKEISLPQLERGDLVTLKSAGAYGAAMASDYNLHWHNDPLYVEK